MRKLTILFALLTLSIGLAQAQETPEPNTLPTPESNQIFYRSSDHQKITLNNAYYFGVAYNDANSVYYQEADYGIISFDGNITKIGDWAFVNRTTLTAVVLPSTMTSIGENAFGYFNCEYTDPIKEFLGEMGEPCEDCPSIEVTKGDKTIKLYNPEKVEFKKE